MHHLPADSATVRAFLGPSAAWSTTEHLLATLVDLTAVSLWQRSGKRSAPKPKPLERPGARKTIGSARFTPNQYERFMAQRPTEGRVERAEIVQ